jgi:Holliday junction resolvase
VPEGDIADVMFMISPEEYEHHVAAVLALEGWATSVTRVARDFGVDVVAQRDDRRLAVQAKMYGGTRTRVNAQQIMCLYGAAAYSGCTERMLATNGELTPDAVRVAAKLEVEVRHIANGPDGQLRAGGFCDDVPSFATVWEEHIMPLAGTTLRRSDGKPMEIVKVDASGVRRITTGNTRQLIAIETFRWAIDRLLAGDTVTRAEIHERDPRQVSSGIVLILSTVPIFEAVKIGRRLALRMPSTAGRS